MTALYGTSELIEQGFGTERIEEAIKHHFHDAGRQNRFRYCKTKIQFEKYYMTLKKDASKY